MRQCGQPSPRLLSGICVPKGPHYAVGGVISNSFYDALVGRWDLAKSGLVLTTIVGLLIAFVPLWNIEGPELVNKILNSKNNQGGIDTTALRLFGNGTFVLALIPLVFWIRKLVRNPLKINLIRHVNTPRYD